MQEDISSQQGNMQNNTGKLYFLGSATRDPNDFVHVIDIEENRSVFFPFNTIALALQELRFTNHESLNADGIEDLVKVLIDNKIYLCSRIHLHPFNRI